MNKNTTEKFYSMEGWEHVSTTVEDVIDTLFWQRGEVGQEGFHKVADRIPWPVEVLVLRRKRLDDGEADRIAANALEATLECLDDEYGSPDDSFEATPAMKAVAKAYAEVVVQDYVPWQCEPTGEMVTVSREEAQAMFDRREAQNG